MKCRYRVLPTKGDDTHPDARVTLLVVDVLDVLSMPVLTHSGRGGVG